MKSARNLVTLLQKLLGLQLSCISTLHLKLEKEDRIICAMSFHGSLKYYLTHVDVDLLNV
ncbi:hypothetical protein V1477_016527 [Vespula maculifrons]|uniref:Uncharacterized protein n=1 Tax=Vespula maculifrons TaxID=7453 RepID=A0ABD2B9G2_VESMC